MQEWMQDKNFKGLVSLVLLLGAIALGMYAYYAYTQARTIEGEKGSITVTGTSEQFVKPDTATLTFSVVAEKKDVAAALSKSAEAVNAIMAYLKEEGIEENDIRTEYYNLYPRKEYPETVCTPYGCPPGRQELVGYTVDQTISVKIREIEKPGQVEKVGGLIAGIGSRGATNMSGPNFTIDAIDEVREKVREDAIKDAREEAERLAGSLGVRLGRMVGFGDNGGGFPMPYYDGYARAEMAKSEDSAAVPNITPGENKVSVSVNLTYEIR